MVDIRWIWLFLHHEEGEPGASPERSAAIDRAWDFWAAMTDSQLSARRGERGEFATLVPSQGDAWVKLQRTIAGDGVHLDLDVDDVDAAAEQAHALGAELVDSFESVRVMRSPTGFAFCFTSWEAGGRPSRQVRGNSQILDQACLDVPRGQRDREASFWGALTGWELRESDDFASLARPEQIPVRLLFQEVDDDRAITTGHPDLACVDRGQRIAEAVALGATLESEFEWWSVLRDPAGLVLCLTGRDPLTGEPSAR